MKESLKSADKNKDGTIGDKEMREVLKKFDIDIVSLDKFKKGSDKKDMVDYIKFLKHYL